jgi:hypothetical protein
MVVKAASQVQDQADHRAARMPLRAATQRLARGTAVPTACNLTFITG